MSTEEFGNFMDALADSGAMSAEAAERIKNAGQWTITVRDEYGNVVEPLAWRENGGTPADPRLLPFLFGELQLGRRRLGLGAAGQCQRGLPGPGGHPQPDGGTAKRADQRDHLTTMQGGDRAR